MFMFISSDDGRRIDGICDCDLVNYIRFVEGLMWYQCDLRGSDKKLNYRLIENERHW